MEDVTLGPYGEQFRLAWYRRMQSGETCGAAAVHKARLEGYALPASIRSGNGGHYVELDTHETNAVVWMNAMENLPKGPQPVRVRDAVMAVCVFKKDAECARNDLNRALREPIEQVGNLFVVARKAP